MILGWSKANRSGKTGQKNKSERLDQMEQENGW